MASKITLVNNGTEDFSFQNHMAGRCLVKAGETFVVTLNPAKDITSQAFLKKFYNQYKDFLEIEFDIDDYPLDLDFEDIATDACADDFDMFGTPVSDLQANVKVADGAVTGDLKYLASGALVDRWGEGNFLALQFGWDDDRLTDVKVGLVPSASGMELQSIFDDPDRNGAWKISDKATQKFVIESYVGDSVINSQELDLSGLNLAVAAVTGGAAPKKAEAKVEAAAPKEEKAEEEPKAKVAAKKASK